LRAQVIAIDADRPEARHLERCAAVLEAGGLIAFPTDSHYGVGCDLANAAAVERLYALKQLPRTKPLSFICADLAEVERYAELSSMAREVMERLAPGPFTFVLPAASSLPPAVVAPQRTVGVRLPDSPVALALVQALGRPLVSSTAAAPEGGVLLSPEDIVEFLGHGLELVLDAGLQLDEPSTVIDLTGEEPRILRQGKGDAPGLS